MGQDITKWASALPFDQESDREGECNHGLLYEAEIAVEAVCPSCHLRQKASIWSRRR